MCNEWIPEFGNEDKTQYPETMEIELEDGDR